MISDKDIEKTVYKVLEDEFELEPSRIKPEARLYEELGLDSLDAVDMVVALEKAFSVKFKDQEALRAIRTVQDIVQLLKRIRDEENGGGDS